MATTIRMLPRSTRRRRAAVLRLALDLERSAHVPGNVERVRAYTDRQTDDAAYTRYHYLAELLASVQAGVDLTPAWADYQAPARERPAAPAACRDTKKEETAS